MVKRTISLAQTLKMYEAYQAGASMEAVGQQFRCNKTAVSKAFANWGLPVRNCGSPKRQIIDVPPRSIALVEPPRVLHWCAQCERRVSAEEANLCGSRFCKAAGQHQALGLAIAGCARDGNYIHEC